MSSKVTDYALLATASVDIADVLLMVDVSDTSMAMSGTTKKFKIKDHLTTYYMPLAGGTFGGSIAVSGVTGLVAGDIPTLTASKISDFASVAASYGPVTSVAGRTGSVTIAAADVASGTFPGTMSWGGAGASMPLMQIISHPGDVPNKITSSNTNGSTFTLNADDGSASFSGPCTASTFIGAIQAPQTLASGTITTNSPALTLTQTWNASGVQFQGFKVNITNTASSATSKVIDIQVGGSTLLSMNTSGSMNFAGTGTHTFAGGIFFSNSSALSMNSGDVRTCAGITCNSNSTLSFCSNAIAGTAFSGSASKTAMNFPASVTLSGGTFTGYSMNPTMSTTSTASWTVLDINPTQSSDTSTGTKLLQRWAVGGTTICSLDVNGVEFNTPQSANPTAPGTDGQVNFYFKGKKVVFQLNDTGTTRYTTLDLTTGTVATSTTPP